MNVRPTPPDAARPQPDRDGASFFARALANRVIMLRLSMLANVALVGVALLQPHFLLEAMHAPQRAVVLDGAGSFTISPIVDLSGATPLQVACAADTINALFQRNPNGFDRPDEVQRWLVTNCREKAARLAKAENPEFKEKTFFQKPTVTEAITVTTTGPKTFDAHVVGQLIRTGVLNDRPHAEVKEYDVRLTFVLNPDMLVNKRYPYALWDFDLRYK